MKSQNAREAAYHVLLAYKEKGLWTGEAVDRINAELSDSRERGLATNIFLGSVQNLYLLDYYISCFSSRDIEDIDAKSRCILECAAYQILFLERVPNSAAVNEAVNLSRRQCPKASGFVNAVLRKLSAAAECESIPELKIQDADEYLSVKYSCSKDLSRYLLQEYGRDFSESFLSASNCVAPITIQINTLKTSSQDYDEFLTNEGILHEKCNGFPDAFLIPNCQISTLPGYEEGLFFVQDNAAASVADIAELTPGMRVLDCCASPGGKSFSAAIRMKGTGSVISCDVSEKKVRMIETGYQRLGLSNGQCRMMDARKCSAEFLNAFDCVICDVPCSGYGVIRKKPEIKYKAFSEIDRLPSIQKEILDNVSGYVKPGGLLIYSTCTVLRSENEDVCTEFLSSHASFRAEPFSKCGFTSENGMHTFWTNVEGTDGFFVAKLRRVV